MDLHETEPASHVVNEEMDGANRISVAVHIVNLEDFRVEICLLVQEITSFQ